MLPKIILPGCKIICCKIVTANVTLSKDAFILIKGIVYSPTGIPLPNAAVEIRLVNSFYIPEREKTLGVTFTIHDGSYGISLPRINECYKHYKLIPYSPV